MNGDQKVLTILGIFTLVFLSVVIWRCLAYSTKVETARQETIKACIAGGKHPLECRDASK